MNDAVELAELVDVEIDDLAALVALLARRRLLRLDAGEEAQSAVFEDVGDDGCLGDAGLA
jgi:hypothetical protein